MMNRLLACILVLSACCYAQAPKAKTPAKSKALVACETQRDTLVARINDVAPKLEQELPRLQKENEELQKQLESLNALFKVLATESFGKPADPADVAKVPGTPPQMFAAAVTIEKQRNLMVDQFNELLKHDAMATDKYNALLADYKDYVERVGIQLAQARQQIRFSNALALYNAMPKYQPYYLPQPATPVNNSIHCTSNTVGTYTYTNCN